MRPGCQPVKKQKSRAARILDFSGGRRPSDFGARTFLSAPRVEAPLGRNADLRSAVSQACGLPASGSQQRSGSLSAPGLRRTACRLEVCDTADRRSALRPRVARGPPISGRSSLLPLPRGEGWGEGEATQELADPPTSEQSWPRLGCISRVWPKEAAPPGRARARPDGGTIRLAIQRQGHTPLRVWPSGAPARRPGRAPR